MYEFTAPFRNPAGSPIRELFRYLGEPGMISFAGGYPASDLFDTEGLKAAETRAWQSPVRCLQYGPTDGLPELNEVLVEMMARRGAKCASEELMVTTGSQQGLDLLLRILVNPGDVVLTEQPTYSATLQAFRLQRAEVVTVPADSEGLDIGKLEDLLARGDIRHPRLLYTVPTFANPTGATLTRERRIALLRLAVKYRLLVIEDDPYGDLRYCGVAVPSILSLTSEVEGSRDWVVHLASLSKIVAPGLRIGWMVAPVDITRRCVIAKQTADLCGTPWTQAVAAQYLTGNRLELHLPRIKAAYRDKLDVLCNSLETEFGNAIDFRRPEGGMFVWARLKGVDASQLLKQAIEHKVIFVPGKAFYHDNVDTSALRLSFVGTATETIQEGVKRLKQACEAVRTAANTSG